MQYDVLVVGAGVVGCATAMELGKYSLRAAVIEAGEDVCTGTSKANSAIVHAGFDARPGSLMARFNVEGSHAMPKLCERLQIPFRRCGALVLCFNEAARPGLEELLLRGVKNGVHGLRIVEREELHELEPNVSPEAVAALYAPTSGIVCPFELTCAMAENAVRNGVEFFFDTRVESIAREGGFWKLETAKGSFEAPVVINAAGLHSAELNNMVSDKKITITPRKGEYMLLDKKVGGMLSRTVFQLPTKMGKGVLVTPTVHGNLLMGPTAVDVEDPEATNTTAAGLESVMQRARKSVPSLPGNRTITSFAGLRAHVEKDEHDFIIGEAEGAPGFLNAVGIESPGLSAAPAIGAFLAESAAYLVSAPANKKYDSTRPEVCRPNEMTVEERAAFVAEHPLYGNIVCRCEQVTEGEIVDAIHRVPGARSLDGVKRRTRAGMGRCQAGFCSPRVLEILSRELGVPQEQLTKSGGASFPIVGKTRKDGENA